MITSNVPYVPFYLAPEDPPAKQAILKAALCLFVRNGLCETSIRAIAAEAGYTNPALFKHFESKEALALYLFERCYRRYSSSIELAIDRSHGFARNLRSILWKFATLYDEDSDSFLFMQENLRLFWPKSRATLHQHSIIALIRQILEYGKESGEVRGDVDLDLLVTGFIGLLSQFGRQIYFGELKGGARDWVDELEKVTMGMVRA